ncbi:autotransporter-associated beta strand repeat-containing protein [Coraliomargarita sp. SDUM461003]|uniref:Autotransporter-associated beta strand repeat-containing protein n=1 Tax=Thalassobacterium maritimum TaxID=3041265 RepID=A0ABU1AX38_9BACT|nr:autotransporter-associated beta strand repeat-containing protein [Coraliomargarita sp. SDUM461003]MDQ8208668.1 autotransporter-associated beta strand repeat-containing protein [Coraliomargarita sp. SDUM461003]
MNHKKYVRNHLLLTLPLSLIGFSTTNLQAQTWTETASGTYNWDDNVNWGSNPFPNAIDAVADVSIDQANPQTVDLNQAITVGTLNFEDNGATTGNSTFNIAAGTGGSLIFQTSSGNASVSLTAPSTARRPKVTISADMVVNSNTTFDTTSSGSTSKEFVLSGDLSGSASITKSGSKGRLRVSGDNSAFTGNWILEGGVSTSYFQISADNSLGAVPVTATNNIIVNNTNTIEFGSGTYTIHENRNILVNSGTLRVGPSVWNSYVTIAGDISGAGGVARVTDKGAGAYIQLSGNNTYTGKTSVTSGALRAGSTTAFGVDSEVVMGTGTYDKHGVLDLNDFDNSIGSLSGGNATKGLVDLGTATLTTGSNDMSTNYAGVIYGTGGVTKVGTGTMTLDGENTYTGATTVTEGSLALGASERLNDASRLILDGGTFATGGFSETMGTVVLSESSIIDLGAGDSDLSFLDSSAEVWTDSIVLSILNFDEGVDSVRFGTDASGLTSTQLSQITLNGGAAFIDASGYLTAVPEVGSFALMGGLLSLGFAVTRRRK